MPGQNVGYGFAKAGDAGEDPGNSWEHEYRGEDREYERWGNTKLPDLARNNATQNARPATLFSITILAGIVSFSHSATLDDRTPDIADRSGHHGSSGKIPATQTTMMLLSPLKPFPVFED